MASILARFSSQGPEAVVTGAGGPHERIQGSTAALVFLASDAGRSVTGQVLAVDGGPTTA